MRVSIALASYNGAEFIGAQLDSLAAQTRRPDEVIISDDGSSDRTLEIVREFSNHSGIDVRILPRGPRLGFCRNFERAILACIGDIIFLSDQDDVWFPEKIEMVTGEFRRDPQAQVLLNGQILTDRDLHEGASVDDNRARLGLDSSQLVIGAATAMRRQWAQLLFPMPVEANALFEGGFIAHDRWINELAEMLGCRHYLPRPLQYWRRHGANVTDATLHDSAGANSASVAGRLKSAPNEAWKKRGAVLKLFADFIFANGAEISAFPSASPDRALRRIWNEQRALEDRILLYRLPRGRRLPGVARLWAAGGYRYFSGFRSAIHDLVRR